MEKFIVHRGVVAPFDRANIDTDLIIPKQFLKSVKRTGFGANLFDQLRYLDEGQPGMDNSKRAVNEKFFLNDPVFRGSTILLTGKNFGCGSSREHAPWALVDYGFRAILAPGFADIFFNNSFKNGLLPIVLPERIIEGLFTSVRQAPGMELTVDLPEQQIILPDGERLDFDIDAFRKKCLLEGLDDIGLTLQKAHLIHAYEARRQKSFPWMFDNLG
jgi:3-isopropylmalate/(R)-2-methylmalate dehydratase small subunit